MSTQAAAIEEHQGNRFGQAERDLVALGIAISALILFVGTGGRLMPQIIRSWLGQGDPPDVLLTNAVLLNIALLIFGWRRYEELRREVAQRRTAEQRARQLAEIDPLTGCHNRRSGPPAIARLCASEASLGGAVAVLMLDLDNFKHINDLNGHKVGDQVLMEVARRVRRRLPSDGVIARIGGDEFVLALPFDPADLAAVDRFATRLIEAVSQPIHHEDVCVEATVSVGIARAVCREGEENVGEDLIHPADVAMYAAKKRGRNRYVWFDERMEEERRLRNELETGIRRGLARGEFVPFYEQQVDLATGELVGFEMLARWNSPQFGLVGPETFIPIAEEMDLIADLSESVIRQALLDAKEWDPSLSLSVNISPLQLRDPWFAQRILRLLADTGFPPARLEIEITENCLHEDLAAVQAIVGSLKNQGIRLSLDDFGTGYASISQLRSLPFDRLKIDRSFVTELAKDGSNNSLVESIVSIGRGLSLPVTAEGVETPAVLEALRKMGDLKGQGYLYGKPEDGETTRARLAALHRLVGDALAGAGEVAAEALGAGPAERKAL
ncbi:GGDEF-domain containing protein [Altererythrobacter sp. B11]|uniref:putative bifunctional diguanylate cyclase/phosphodiesterase n=1 Tax=Altererythrobacter sp. B11 TaxID=2060312 RepID=UPI000DC6E6DB|nr:GGDEF domain-containing phosphodiesterase [Altererythrobacter sp. B11]BBC73612.1 GGDEF-domain containing protein [Altererythrobacter sp. B11]